MVRMTLVLANMRLNIFLRKKLFVEWIVFVFNVWECVSQNCCRRHSNLKLLHKNKHWMDHGCVFVTKYSKLISSIGKYRRFIMNMFGSYQNRRLFFSNLLCSVLFCSSFYWFLNKLVVDLSAVYLRCARNVMNKDTYLFNTTLLSWDIYGVEENSPELNLLSILLSISGWWFCCAYKYINLQQCLLIYKLCTRTGRTFSGNKMPVVVR